MRNVQELITIVKEGFDKSLMVAKFFCILHVASTYICTPVQAKGPSMLPTINLTGDLLLAERISKRFGKVGPGDIVLVRSPENPRKIIAKRVKGMEGDTVAYTISDRRETVVVPEGHIWIEGDNLHDSTDSRKFGVVPYDLIQGKVFWRIWPPEGFGSVG
ncbi:hypothetical protein U1Q18_009527 [Sarracenia purpurea var. burkii]